MQLPRNLKSVAFNFKAPEGEEDLTEAEYVILLQVLFQEQNPTLDKANQGTRREPLVNSLSARKTNVAIPSSLDQAIPLKNQKDNVLPLESLELHGANINHAVLKELCYCSIHASQECGLQSLVIRGANLDCGVTVSGPLMRSLRKLTVKDCKNLKIVDPCTWALFFGTIPLESLSIHNSGFDCNDFTYLCQVLCANETPSLNLKKLELIIGKHKLSIERNRTRYSDANFVHITRCLSKLADLESIKLDCLNTDQKLHLYEEWKALKGSNQCFIQSDELSTFLHLAIDLHMEEEEGVQEVVRFEQRSIITQHDSSIHKIPSWKARAPVKFSDVCDHREIQFRNQTSRQRRPILTSSKTRLNPSQPAGATEHSHQSVLDKLWTRYKPPRLKPTHPYHQPRRFSRQQRQRCSLTRQTKVHDLFVNSLTDLQQTREKRQRSRSRRLKVPPPKSKPSLDMGQSESLTDDETSASSEEYDLEEELGFGPPPGGRTVIMERAEGTPNLRGYTHDGFIRPDDEMVYTTSASEGEIERDLDALQKRYETVMSTSNSTLDEASDQESLGTPSPTSLADHSAQTLVLSCPDQTSKEHNLRDSIDELQKELMELQPFYYDEQREKFKPGKIFSDLEPAGAESSGVTLRNGKRLGIEAPSTVVVPLEDTTDFSSRFEMASGSNLVSCIRQRVDKTALSTTDMEDVSRMDEETSAMDQDLNQSCPRDSKDRKRHSREALKLQPWSWDPKYEKCPPNYQMYMTSNKKRRGRLSSVKEKQDKERDSC